MSRYTQDQQAVVANFFNKLATTSNKTGKMLESKKAKIMQSWDVFPTDVVMDALHTYLKMDVEPAKGGKGKNEKYVLGIMKNKATARGGVHGGGNCTDSGINSADEGDRLKGIIAQRKTTDADLDCDF